MRRTSLVAAALALSAAVSGCGVLGIGEEPADLQVYSARHYDLEEAFAEFRTRPASPSTSSTATTPSCSSG